MRLCCFLDLHPLSASSEMDNPLMRNSSALKLWLSWSIHCLPLRVLQMLQAPEESVASTRRHEHLALKVG